MSEFTKPYEEKMDGALRHLDKELVAIRAGRANPAILDRVTVDYYGSPTPINQMAAVAVAEARILTITPWDASLIHAIEHALSAFHPDLPHGAGLIMISNAYWKRFAEVAGARMAAIARAMGKADATRPEDFLAALAEMQQACGVDTLRLADYGVREEDCGKIAENAVVTMGGLFRADPRRLESGEIEDIIRESI